MDHKHSLYDTDPHFVIDPVSRQIKNQSGKTVLMRYDHNSERFTFEIPRKIDDHDMSLCNKTEIHYINIGNKERVAGVYEVEDLQIYPDDESVVVLSWLISQNATQLSGKLSFVIRFSCYNGEELEYSWNTDIYSDMKIGDGIYNSDVIVEQYADVLHQWKEALYAEGLKISSMVQTTTSKVDGGTNIVTVTFTDGSTQTLEIRNGSKGNPGSSIASIEQTAGDGSPGSTDTYTVRLTDGSAKSFNIKNGTSIVSIDRTSGDGLPGSIDTYTVTLTDGSITAFQVYNGIDGTSIQSIERTEGNGSSGSIDTYTITLTDGSKHTFQVYNGADGDGAGDMVKGTYDPQGKNQDIFKYTDDAVDGKQNIMADTSITGVVCYKVTFDDTNTSYTLPTTIELDEDAFYYIECDYYTDGVDNAKYSKYCVYTFSKVIDGVVRWCSNDVSKAITLSTTGITNNWRDDGHTTVVSIYKVSVEVDNPLNIVAVNAANGYKTVAPGGYNASAEGHKTVALGYAAHSQNRETMALGDYSSAEGLGTIADGDAQSVHGKYNQRDEAGDYALIIGNGESDDSRSNAYTLDWDGNANYAGGVKAKTHHRLSDDYIKRKLGYLGNGIEYDDLEESKKDGTYHRMWGLRFPKDSEFWGKIRIILIGGYHSHNASGVMSKDINLSFEGSSIYNNTGYYSDLGGAVETDFRISEALWNSEVEAWEILVWQKNLYGNNGCLILVEAWADGSEYIDAINGMTYADPEFVQDTTYESWGWMGNSSQNRTVTWADAPVLESPYGERILTKEYADDNYVSKSEGGSGGIISGTCSFGGDITGVYHKQPLPDGKFAVTLHIEIHGTIDSNVISSSDVPIVLSISGQKSIVGSTIQPLYSVGAACFATLNSGAYSGDTGGALSLYMMSTDTSTGNKFSRLTTGITVSRVMLEFYYISN